MLQEKFALVYHEGIDKYDFGEGHPFRGGRFSKFMDFFLKKFEPYRNEFSLITPEPATEKDLELIHTRDYIKAIESASMGIRIPDILKFVSLDNLNPYTRYIPENIDKGAKLIVGTSLLAGELVAKGKFKKAIGIGGGLHHAKVDYGEGFCFYNDIAICVENLKRKFNFERILVLDTDAHAGNGTKEIFYKDEKVLFIDIHQNPTTIYPGTGFISEIGEGKGEGFTINIPLEIRTGEDSYQYIFENLIFPVTKEFQPQVIVRYGGSDPHYMDGLTNLGLSIKSFRMIGEDVRELSRNTCNGKVIDLITSGYNMEILPLAWSSLISGLLDIDIDIAELDEENPYKNFRYEETKGIVKKIKNYLKKYWKSLE